MDPGPGTTPPEPWPPWLLDELRSGQEKAWTVAFQRLWPIALKAGLHPELRLTRHEAEEVASATLAALVGRVSEIRTPDQLKALAATIAYRQAVSVSRRKHAAKRQPAAGFAEAPEGAGVENLLLPPEDPGLNEVEHRELAILMRNALATLDPLTFTLIHEKIGLGMSYEELSRRHQMPLGTICARVARGLRRVRQHLQEKPALMNELQDHLR